MESLFYLGENNVDCVHMVKYIVTEFVFYVFFFTLHISLKVEMEKKVN